MANQTTKYVVTTEEGIQEFANLGLVGKFLGKKITKKDLEAGKYPMVSLQDADTEEDTTDEVADKTVGQDGIEVPDDSTGFDPDPELDEHTLQVISKVEQAINDTPEDNTELFDGLCDLEDALRDKVTLSEAQATLLTKVLTNTLNVPDTDEDDTDSEGEPTPPAPPSDVEYPEVGDFKDEKAIKKFIKGLSDASLEEWCILEGVEWKHNDHESINRMRMAMAIKAKHFPTTAPSKGKKSKSKYAQYATEDLVQMALDNDIEVPDDKGDMRICRMYTIMALKKAGLLD